MDRQIRGRAAERNTRQNIRSKEGGKREKDRKSRNGEEDRK